MAENIILGLHLSASHLGYVRAIFHGDLHLLQLFQTMRRVTVTARDRPTTMIILSRHGRDFRAWRL